MSKKKKLLIFSIAALLVIGVIVLIGQLTKEKPLEYTYNHSANTVASIESGDYATYVSQLKKYLGIAEGENIKTPQETVVIKGSDYYANNADSNATTALVQNQTINAVTSAGAPIENIDVLLVGNTDSIVYKVNVPVAGNYNIVVNYVTYKIDSELEEKQKVDENYDDPFKSFSSSIERKLLVITSDEEINEIFEDNMGKQSYVFSRVWKRDSSGTNHQDITIANGKYDDLHSYLNLAKDTNGNDVKPSQVEEENVYVSTYLSDYMGYVTEPYQYYFTEGENTLVFSAIKESIRIHSIEIVPVQTTKTYAQYVEENQAKANKAPADYSYRIEAEASSYTSSPTLNPITDRTSSNTYPFSIKETKLNSMGGDSWKVLGDWIIWDFEVPEDGWYNISLRARQNLVRGMYSHRKVYIDGEIPFEELKQTVFQFSSDWQNITLGSNDTGEAFKFYLEKGKHQIKMEVTLGVYGELVEELENITGDLNKLYLDIIKYTTASPDTNRDYNLHNMESFGELNLLARIQDASTRLQVVSKEIARISSKNADKPDEKGDGEIYKDGKSDKTGVIDTLVEQLNLFLENPNKVTKQLSSFSTNVSSLGTLLSTLQEFPLTVDYIAVYAADGDYEMKKANEGFFRSVWNSIVSFFYSFIIDYSEIGTLSDDKIAEGVQDIEIEVWMTMGRDQANVIRKLIDTDFGKKIFKINGKDSHVSVNLKLTGGDVLLRASLAGVGPEVAINVDSSLPVNYGLRGAALDLKEAFGEDYEKHVNANFKPSSIRQFTFDGATYALPEKQLYMMMFVRTDIMADLYGENWEDAVPQTWDEVLSMMTDLQTDALQFYLPVNDAGASALNPAFVSMLYQRGGRLYSEDAKETGLLSEVAMDTFEYWTDFYTKYSFPKSASFLNRFRSGEMPIGISYYEMYNTLAVFAPEIRGDWAFYPVPGTAGTITDDNNVTHEIINHTSVATGSGAIITAKNAARDADKKYAAWEFLKWWTSMETQRDFGREMEGILGISARHATANYNAFQELAWPKADMDTLLKQWGVVTKPTQTTLTIDGEVYLYEEIDGVKHLYGVREIPQIAGSYITGREVENAYRKVINNNVNAKETLYKYAQNINNEIDRKRSEFGLPLKDEE